MRYLFQGQVEDLQRAASLTGDDRDAADNLHKVCLVLFCTHVYVFTCVHVCMYGGKTQRLKRATLALHDAAKRRERSPLRRVVHETVIIEELPTNVWETEEADRGKVPHLYACVEHVVNCLHREIFPTVCRESA